MLNGQLRIYSGPVVETVTEEQAGPETITLPLGDILPLLADAVNSKRTWLRDFKDDDITISSDLYEVALAYQHFRRPSA